MKSPTPCPICGAEIPMYVLDSHVRMCIEKARIKIGNTDRSKKE